MPEARPDFLPACPEDLVRRGWKQLDVLLITGDAHVDHPAFPANLLGRWLESFGFRVGLIARPRPDEPNDLSHMGAPRLFVGLSAGALDSMVANRTALGKRRSDDAYAPGGRAGGRPDRWLTVYGQLARRAFGKQVLLVAGGLEASLRRFAHYDFWSDKVRRSLLMDCGVDLLVHGMGEGPILAIARRLDGLEGRSREQKLEALSDIPGLVYREARSSADPPGAMALACAEEVAADKRSHAIAFATQESHRAMRLFQDVGGMRVVSNPAWPELSQAELDRVYGLSFRRQAHPMYAQAPIPALEQVRFSLTSHRGCAGGCAFCAITAHQGLRVSSRSFESIFDEIRQLVRHPEFAGTITDVGGPTANLFGARCRGPNDCPRVSCLWPRICPKLELPETDYQAMLDRAAKINGIKHLFVSTGLRLDLLSAQPGLLTSLIEQHTSGHFKVAPEHLAPAVLERMRKPKPEAFVAFLKDFARISARAGKRQFPLPYLMAAHPGCHLEDMLETARFLRSEKLRVEQVQIFTPTPGTASTVMYATGLEPHSLAPVFVERGEKAKRMQKALLLSHLPESGPLVRQALDRLGRQDLWSELKPLAGSKRGRKR